MSKIVDKYVEDYIRNTIPKNEGFIREMEVYAKEHNVPIIQPEVAKFLEVIIKSSNTKRILEIGTAIGYSSIIFSRAMEGKGEVVTIEMRQDMYDLAIENIMKSGYQDNIKVLLGDAREIIGDVEGKFDMIFLDAAKGHYLKFLLDCINMLKNNGIIVSDNVLYKGMVATNEYLVRRKITIVKRMRKYLNYISNHSQLTTSIIPIGDGIALSFKEGSEFNE